MIHCRYATKHHELRLKGILSEELIFILHYLLRYLQVIILHALFANKPLYFVPFPSQIGKRVTSRNNQDDRGPTDDFTNETSTAIDSII